MKLNYSIILTKEEIENISQEKLEYIKEAASKTLNKINYKRQRGLTFKGSNEVFSMQNRARELVFISDYKDEDFITKTLITSNVIYPNSKTIIDILLSKNITYDILNKNISKLKSLKQLALLKDSLPDIDSITITDKNLNTICRIIERYFSCDNYNLIIAKLVQIVVYEKELFTELEMGHQLQKTR